MYCYRGNLHIHSTYSDGTGSVEEIARAAERAELDFIILTDHNTFAPLREGKQGWWGRTLVLFGQEIGNMHNHYLALGHDEEVEPDDEHPQRVIDSVLAKGGFGFIAHPDDIGTPLDSGGHAFTWTDWNVTGYAGIEVWNFTSHWKAPVQGLVSGLRHYFLDFDGFVGTPPADTVARWLALTMTRRVTAVGTSDAHDLRVHAAGLTLRIFPYELCFRRITMHLWTAERLSGQPDEAERDRRLLFEALRDGHSFISDRGAGDAQSASMVMEGRAANAIAGDELAFEPGMELAISLPEAADIRVLKNGRPWRRVRGRLLREAIDGPGVFVLHACRRHRLFGERTWILSNPIYVRPSLDAERLAAALRARGG